LMVWRTKENIPWLFLSYALLGTRSIFAR